MEVGVGHRLRDEALVEVADEGLAPGVHLRGLKPTRGGRRIGREAVGIEDEQPVGKLLRDAAGGRRGQQRGEGDARLGRVDGREPPTSPLRQHPEVPLHGPDRLLHPEPVQGLPGPGAIPPVAIPSAERRPQQQRRRQGDGQANGREGQQEFPAVSGAARAGLGGVDPARVVVSRVGAQSP